MKKRLVVPAISYEFATEHLISFCRGKLSQTDEACRDDGAARRQQACGDRRRTCAAHRPRQRGSPSHIAQQCNYSSCGRSVAGMRCRWRVGNAIPGRASAARFVRARGGSDRPPDQMLRLLPVFPSWNCYRCTCLAPLFGQFCFSRGGTCGAVIRNRSSTNPASRTHKNDVIYVIYDQYKPV